ncbi:MAG: heavy-metal-associated domain-containing protein, partial [bacterium]
MHAHVEESAAETAGQRNISEFTVGGMSCQNCARHVTEAIQSVSGVAGADVGLESGRATVRWKSGVETNVETVVQAVKEAGYDAALVEEQGCHARPSGGSPMAAWKFTLVFGAVLTVPLIVGEWVFGWGMS